jgi:hypothetical protein
MIKASLFYPRLFGRELDLYGATTPFQEPALLCCLRMQAPRRFLISTPSQCLPEPSPVSSIGEWQIMEAYSASTASDLAIG